MGRTGMPVFDAAQEWVKEMNAIPKGMIEKLIAIGDDDIREVTIPQTDDYDEALPMWGTMWSFGDSADDWWLEEGNGIDAMSKCGFRVYESQEFGYFFGIDGAGYDFFEAHWCPLYKARGLQWHDPVAEEEYQMTELGYVKRSLGTTTEVWMDGNRTVKVALKYE